MKDTLVRKKKKFDIGAAINYFLMTILVIVCCYPFINVVAYSFSGYTAVLSGSVKLFPKDFTLQAYIEILNKKQIWQAMWTTIKVTLLGTSLSMVLTIIAAYALSRRDLPGRTPMSMLILFTMYFGGGMIPTFMVVKAVGLYDTIGALFIPQAINVFNFIIMRTFFNQLPHELEEAAIIDGASVLQVLVKIILPLSLPVIATVALYYAVNYWNNYFDALVYIQSPEKYSLQLRLRDLLFGAGLDDDMDYEKMENLVMPESLKMAIIVVSALPILMVYPWLQKYFVKGVMVGSIKG